MNMNPPPPRASTSTPPTIMNSFFLDFLSGVASAMVGGLLGLAVGCGGGGSGCRGRGGRVDGRDQDDLNAAVAGPARLGRVGLDGTLVGVAGCRDAVRLDAVPAADGADHGRR